MAIALSKLFLKTTILENNIIQTTGSAGESIAAGVVFTLPGFLFLSEKSSSEYFNYLTILTLAIFGGILGTLMMIPLRKALIVKEHGNLPYPEGTACASVLKAGEKGGDFAKTAFLWSWVLPRLCFSPKDLSCSCRNSFLDDEADQQIFPFGKNQRRNHS